MGLSRRQRATYPHWPRSVPARMLREAPAGVTARGRSDRTQGLRASTVTLAMGRFNGERTY